MENAEVLELTVKRVQGILQSRSLGECRLPPSSLSLVLRRGEEGLATLKGALR